jgi:hypothetical protein
MSRLQRVIIDRLEEGEEMEEIIKKGLFNYENN